MAAQSETAAQCREVARLVRQLTESGRDSPDPAQLQQLKQLCRRGDAVIDAMYERALKQLRRQHAQVRLSALQLLDQLFRRSHRLRTRLVADLPTVLDLCFETGGTLPPPRAVAKQLTATAAAALTHWTEKYGSAYKKLSVGYRYLHQVRPGDMPPTAEERQEAAAEEERRQEELRRLRRVKLEQVEREVTERRAEIMDTVTQAESCLQLLVPDVEMWDGGDYGKGATAGTGKSEEKSRKSPGATTDSNHGDEIDGDSKMDDGARETSESSLLNSEYPAKSADSEVTKSATEPSDSEGTDDEADYDEYDADYAETGVLRSHGLTSARQTVQVTVAARPRPLVVTEDNRCVVEALRELAEQVRRRQLPDVQRWLQLTDAAGGDERALASLRTVRAALTSVLRRCSLLQLSPTSEVAADSSDDDSDMEEVPELAATPTVAAASGSASAKGCSFDQAIGADGADRGAGGSLIDRSWVAPDPSLESQNAAGSDPSGIENQGKMNQSSTAANSARPAQSPSVALPEHAVSSAETSYQRTSDNPLKPEAVGPGTGAASAGEGSDSRTEKSAAESRKQRLLRVAPVLDYSADLVTWERQLGAQVAPPAPQLEVARVWRGSSEADLPASSAPDTVRVAEFSGRFEPVQHRCGARLPSGRLCPRADRVRCPLHGPIIPRDSQGEPLDPSERNREKEARARGPDWQDPKLLADLLAKTGQDLRVSRGRRRGAGPGLVPIHGATARQRLSNKLFCGRTVRRLAAALNQLDARRHGDKFADQFNYHFNR